MEAALVQVPDTRRRSLAALQRIKARKGVTVKAGRTLVGEGLTEKGTAGEEGRSGTGRPPGRRRRPAKESACGARRPARHGRGASKQPLRYSPVRDGG